MMLFIKLLVLKSKAVLSGMTCDLAIAAGFIGGGVRRCGALPFLAFLRFLFVAI